MITPVTESEPTQLSDQHVHTEFSWDAERGDMVASCAAALRLGLRSIAFTEHADFTAEARAAGSPVDIDTYLEAVDNCRRRFPDLRIRSGIELGEPHLHRVEVGHLLAVAGGRLERVLGSVHVVAHRGRNVDPGTPTVRIAERDWPTVMEGYLGEVLHLVESDTAFEVLAHLGYPKRFWPHDRLLYDDAVYEEELRAILRAAAQRGLVLEANSTRGAPAHRGLCPSPLVLRWWRECGGRTVSLGSDAHEPAVLARGLDTAREAAVAAGFTRSVDDLLCV